MSKVTVIPPNERGKETLRVAAYCRVSSDSADQKHSYAAQIRAYTDLIGSHPGWELVDIYADEARTGTRADIREDFQRLLADCRKGKIDKVLVKSISRFARNTRDCLAALRELSALGVSVEFEEDHIDTGTLTTELMVSVSGALAQQESVSISQNQRMSYRRRMRRGEFITCFAPYGYDVEGKILTINREQAEVIKYVFEHYLSGNSSEKIAEELTRYKIPTQFGKTIWNDSSVRYILRNEKYLGNTLCQKYYTTETLPFVSKVNRGEYDQYYVENTHAPIIAQETFENVQRLLNRRNQRISKEKSHSIFCKRIYCAKCGRVFIRRKTKAGYITWVCKTHDQKADTCTVGRIPEAEIYHAFVKLYNKLHIYENTVLSPGLEQFDTLNKALCRNNPSILALNKEIADTAEQSYKLQRLQAAGLLDMEACAARHNTLEAKLTQLRDQRRRLLQTEELDELISPIRQTAAVIHNGPERLEAFDEALFADLVDHIIVESQTSIRFCLHGGIELREQIREVRR